ncbi:hypothetical protein BC351_40030 [Paenibacillus ferrarius]|uniref:Fibrobacter succinogenes major paralogous domain-containing protein n=1 Tax=Paenibacillus ferrarius TaxID=1469647 RepID=A0A1V4H8E4_9BACL|nr:hypothetical protein [Paenibacillus ferrarius]OPH47396.1 hypothetical protein BC351_40030 [Paenibacillus ferrarius]
MKKISIVLLICFILASVQVGAAAAPINGKMSERQLDQILLKSGFPQSYLNVTLLQDKEFIVGKSGTEMQYQGRTVEKYRLDEENNLVKIDSGNDGELTPMATIPTSDLDVWFDTFKVSVNGVYHQDVYPQFLWKKGIVTINDSIGVAVPQGWEIISSENSCQTYWAYQSTGPWSADSNCGGRPAQTSVYGFEWKSLWNASIHPYGNPTFEKGTAYLRMKKTDSNAYNRVVGNYVHDTTAKSNATYQLTLYWLSVLYQPSSGTIDTAGFDKTFTY